jgi:hypothetical protein
MNTHLFLFINLTDYGKHDPGGQHPDLFVIYNQLILFGLLV